MSPAASRSNTQQDGIRADSQKMDLDEKKRNDQDTDDGSNDSEQEDDDDDDDEDDEEDDDEDEEMQDEGYATLTQQLNENTDRSQYDPFQSKEERRKIRKSYRSLISLTEENRRDYTSTSNNGLADTVMRANALYEKVRNTQEATLDSRLLVLSADISTQKARNLRLDFQLFNPDEFVSKIKTLGGNDDHTQELDWKAIGMRAAKFGHRVQSIDFMLGPLSVEKKQRKATRPVRLVKNKEDLVQPTQLKEQDIQQQENETSANVNAIYRILDERGPTNYLEFVTNPESFSQTVENIFYVSFLIRNAVAEIDDSSGQPILSTRAPPKIDELAANLTKKQLIMKIDTALWKEIIEIYGIRTPIIPTRAKRQSVATDKWY